MTLLGITSSEVRWQSPENESTLQSTVTIVMSDGESDDDKQESKQDAEVTDDEVPVEDAEGETGELDDFNEEDFDDDFDDDFEEEIEDEEFQDEDEFDLGIDIS